MIYFVVPRDQEFGILDYMETWGQNLLGLVSILHYEELPERKSLPGGTYIFSALDQLTAGGLKLVSEIQDQLKASPVVGRVLNDPNTALMRLGLLEELHRSGRNRHRAFKATGDLDALNFPVFLHEEFRHTGALSPLLSSRTELERALGRAVLQGFRLGELLVVEFCDTVDAEGLYRKYTAYVVGPEVFARTMGRGRDWMLKAGGVEFSQDLVLEERAYVFSNPYEDQLREIFSIAGIEYGRIDFALKDGAVETWEINTNPTVGPSRRKVMPDEFREIRKPIRDLFSERFFAALKALDRDGGPEPVPLTFSPGCLEGAFPLVHPVPSKGVLGRIAHALQPAKPLFDAAARVCSPLLARVGRRLQ